MRQILQELHRAADVAWRRAAITPRNVARCWTYETALALNMDISDGKFLFA